MWVRLNLLMKADFLIEEKMWFIEWQQSDYESMRNPAITKRQLRSRSGPLVLQHSLGLHLPNGPIPKELWQISYLNWCFGSQVQSKWVKNNCKQTGMIGNPVIGFEEREQCCSLNPSSNICWVALSAPNVWTFEDLYSNSVHLTLFL